jgi:flavin-dependent dehydrogenase
MAVSYPNEFDVVVIGGGLAGLVSSYELAKNGQSVALLEKNNYPKHKVCGEYISNEVKPYLQRIGLYPDDLKPHEINRFLISSISGNSAQAPMQMGGFGISRFAFDAFLYQKAAAAGVQVFTNTTALNIYFKENHFRIKTKGKSEIKARLVLGAHGKRSLVDKALNRSFMHQKSTYVGVKQHFKGDFSNNQVALHNFEGGYCGLSQVENKTVNLCYLTTFRIFKRYRDVQELNEKHLSKNPFLKNFLQNATPVFEKPLVISQVNFQAKPQVENHVLMLGDAAGMIHPLCGNGMAMAIHGAKIAAEQSSLFLEKKITRQQLENNYQQLWQNSFSRRLRFGRSAQKLFGRNAISKAGVGLAKASPTLLRRVITLAHGRYI